MTRLEEAEAQGAAADVSLLAAQQALLAAEARVCEGQSAVAAAVIKQRTREGGFEVGGTSEVQGSYCLVKSPCLCGAIVLADGCAILH